MNRNKYLIGQHPLELSYSDFMKESSASDMIEFYCYDDQKLIELGELVGKLSIPTDFTASENGVEIYDGFERYKTDFPAVLNCKLINEHDYDSLIKLIREFCDKEGMTYSLDGEVPVETSWS